MSEINCKRPEVLTIKDGFGQTIKAFDLNEAETYMTALENEIRSLKQEIAANKVRDAVIKPILDEALNIR